jgi:hypothetical protein
MDYLIGALLIAPLLIACVCFYRIHFTVKTLRGTVKRQNQEIDLLERIQKSHEEQIRCYARLLSNLENQPKNTTPTIPDAQSSETTICFSYTKDQLMTGRKLGNQMGYEVLLTDIEISKKSIVITGPGLESCLITGSFWRGFFEATNIDPAIISMDWLSADSQKEFERFKAEWAATQSN